MKSFNCPSCGAQIDFRSSITLYSICSYCQSVVVRNDLDVEAIGKVAQLKEDSSPFALGTQGQYAGASFTLIGRIVRGWEDGQWNEWFMLLHDQRRGWLAEAQGQLMVYFEADSISLPATKLPSKLAGTGVALPTWQVGELVHLGKQVFTVTDIKDVRCIGSEGELPRYLKPGETTQSIDLTAPPKSCATIEFDGQGCQLYLGTYVGFDECRFEYLRTVPGW